MIYNAQLEMQSLYDIMNDEEIVLLAKAGNERAANYLILKYRNIVRARTKTYYIVGADRDDIFQEGMIGLFKAIRDFKGNKSSSFKSFADICISRQIITAIKAATREKHRALNSYISFNKAIFSEETEKTLIDCIGNIESISDPEELVIIKESVARMEAKLNNALTKLELEVLKLYIEGRTYQEVASEMEREVKSIDNALQRVKRKLESFFDDDDI